jgi:hypothetical protein
MVAEMAVMEERFPQFVLKRGARGSLLWEGVLKPVPGFAFLVHVAYPERYPYSEPVLWVVRPGIRSGAPHLYLNGTLCVHRDAWNSATGTAASMIPLASDWLRHYLFWERTGEWA